MKKLIVLTIILLLFGCGAYREETRPAALIPRFSDEYIPKGYEFEGNTVSCKVLDSLVKIKYMESSDIDLFFLKHNLSNPFMASPILRDNLTVFLVTFVNNEERTIRFDPRRASIYIKESYYRGSLDFTEVMIAFEKFAPGSDSDQFKKTMYDLELEIPSRSTVEGLIIFPFLPKGSKKIIVMLSGILIRDQTFTVPFEFEEK
ncbi:MAG: hypothetical protein JW765_12805 [Deltaproteobacteria bacterium]|nr:hypothetical protein [Candidatus Zymogenaceae bacterium]